MIGEVLGEVVGMFWGLLSAVLPYLLGAGALVLVVLLGLAVWWAMPRQEDDPVPLIEPGSSDWLGEP